MTRPVLRWIAWALTGAYWLLLFTITHVPARGLPTVKVSDKAIHFTSYALLGGSLYVCFWLMNVTMFRTAIYVTLMLFAYGAVDEVLQIPVGRTCDLDDWLADAGGVVLAVSVMTLVRLCVERAYRRSAEQ